VEVPWFHPATGVAFTCFDPVYRFCAKIECSGHGVGKHSNAACEKTLQLQGFSRTDFLPQPARSPVMWATVEEVRTFLNQRDASAIKMMERICKLQELMGSTELKRAA
jgi:hypothetical protein